MVLFLCALCVLRGSIRNPGSQDSNLDGLGIKPEFRGSNRKGPGSSPDNHASQRFLIALLSILSLA
ncbi:hypothetical protein, partial [Endozoicomonas sp. ONNA2]|uniref:hypothetical protein n=1 Tax=Endozoicomonas sp. ONNA2 TaxID=2828741 RepID=UPI0021480727